MLRWAAAGVTVIAGTAVVVAVSRMNSAGAITARGVFGSVRRCLA
jgi:hypothetical protein